MALRRFLLPAAILSLLVFSCTTTGDPVEESAVAGGTDSLRVGVLLPLSGNLEVYSRDFVKGITCFEKSQADILAEDSKMLDIITYDNAGTTAGTLAGCKELIKTEKVDVIVGPLASMNARPAIDFCTKENVPIIPLWATANDLVQSSPGAYRIVYSDSFTGFLLGKFAVENLRALKAAVVYSNYYNDVKEGFIEAFSELQPSGEVREFPFGDDMDTALGQLREFSPDVVCLAFTTAGEESFKFISRAEDLGLSAMYVGDTDWSTADPAELAGFFESEVYFLNHYSSDAWYAEGKAFGEYYQGIFGEEPSGLAALAYETLLVISQAARGELSETIALTEALAGGEFSGLLGKLRFDAGGDIQKSGVFLKIAGGTSEYVTTVVPDIFSLDDFKEDIALTEKPAEERPRITILNLDCRNVDESEGLIVTELISSAIVKTGYYQVIEAGQRDKVFEESAFALSGLTEDNQIELGRMLAAKRMIAGSLSYLGERYILNMKMLDIESGETVFATYKLYSGLTGLLEDGDYFTYELISRDPELKK